MESVWVLLAFVVNAGPQEKAVHPSVSTQGSLIEGISGTILDCSNQNISEGNECFLQVE